MLERRFEVRRGDVLGLLAALGRDSAGALVLLPPDDGPPDERAGHLEPIEDGQLETLILELGERPLGADERVRVSLTGQQEKLLLARTADGQWARPLDGAPSTHILKPSDERFPGYAANEALCVDLARGLGLTDVEVSVFTVGERSTMAISRYDRVTGPDGIVRRIHQEDFCQALGVDCTTRDRKYERDGGPSFGAIARSLQRFGAPGDVRTLARAMALNVALGNADAHGRNFSLLHHENGSCTFAPLYDLACIVHHPTVITSRGLQQVNHDLAMTVNGVKAVDAVTLADLSAEAMPWGIDPPEVEALLVDLAALLDALEGNHDETLVIRLRRRAAALLSGQAAGAHAPP